MMAAPTMVAAPSSVDRLADMPEITKLEAAHSQRSIRSAANGTVTTETESLSSSSVESEVEHLNQIDAAVANSEQPETSFSNLSISTSPGSRSSILKRRNSDLSTIKDSKRAWKCLPKPDLASIVGNANFTTETTATLAVNDSLSSRKSVEWGVVQIRSYGQTIGDNPSVSYGAPIQLDWDYEVHDELELDNYEFNRGPRRTLRQMVLSYYHRKNVLSWQYGHTEEEIKAAKKEASRLKFKREITRNFLIAMPAEAVVESARRKAKRFFQKKEEEP